MAAPKERYNDVTGPTAATVRAFRLTPALGLPDDLVGDPGRGPSPAPDAATRTGDIGRFG
ncbi:MAG: hypothetical protein AAF742_08980 [Pseudomonadota bacterium]